MAILDKEIAHYNAIRENLERHNRGEWVLIHGDNQVGIYASFDAAAQVALSRFGIGPCLIREIGGNPLSPPTLKECEYIDALL